MKGWARNMNPPAGGAAGRGGHAWGLAVGCCGVVLRSTGLRGGRGLGRGRPPGLVLLPRLPELEPAAGAKRRPNDGATMITAAITASQRIVFTRRAPLPEPSPNDRHVRRIGPPKQDVGCKFWRGPLDRCEKATESGLRDGRPARCGLVPRLVTGLPLLRRNSWRTNIPVNEMDGAMTGGSHDRRDSQRRTRRQAGRRKTAPARRRTSSRASFAERLARQTGG